MIDFSDNVRLAAKAAERFENMGDLPSGYQRLDLVMDLTAADGCNGNPPLDWHRLLEFDDFNFLHDLHGIRTHLDRSTGEVTGCFLPRCAFSRPQQPDTVGV